MSTHILNHYGPTIHDEYFLKYNEFSTWSSELLPSSSNGLSLVKTNSDNRIAILADGSLKGI